MALTFGLPVLTGVAAVTLCVSPMLSNTADAQRFGPRVGNHRYYISRVYATYRVN